VSTVIDATTLLFEPSITEILFEKVLATYIFPLSGSYATPAGSKKPLILPSTLFVELSVTDIVPEPRLVTNILSLPE
jgi:hypothetical protein